MDSRNDIESGTASHSTNESQTTKKKKIQDTCDRLTIVAQKKVAVEANSK